MEKISIKVPIKKIVDKHPKVQEIMVSLGFKHIADPAMLNTVGRIITIKKGVQKHKLDLEMVKETFLKEGFILEDTDEWVYK